MTTLDITTIAFPTEALRDRIAELVPASDREDLDLVVWSAEEPDADPQTLDAVVLNYLSAPATVARLAEAPNLKLLQVQTTGYDVVTGYLDELAVASGAGAHADATAELAVGLALARLRGIDDAARDMLTGSWNHSQHRSLVDRKTMIIGVGGIGEGIRARLEPFGVDITRVGTRARTDEHGPIHATAELPELLPDTEVVILITPLTDSTRHLVDKDFLSRLPDGALIVNVARGQVVDTDALVAELESGRLQAALDVVDPEPLPADHPLWKTPNTLVVPHLGGNTDAFTPRIEKILAEQVRRIQRGDELLNQVN
jgi:phosphoglycerate dehydrogenase-like enzyme